MKGTAKRKVLTSGRLTGGMKGQQARRRVTPNPAACSQPAYSLYSTDSEDQVTTLHKGLDRCAALLSGILQAEKAAKPSVTRAVEGGGAKAKSSVTLGKKTTKRPPAGPPPNQKSSRSTQSYPGLKPIHQSSPSKQDSPSPARVHHEADTAAPTATTTTQSTEATHQTQPESQHPSSAVPPSQPQTSILLSVSQSHSHNQASSHLGWPPPPLTQCQPGLKAPDSAPLSGENQGREEDECVPVRDMNTQLHTQKQTCTAMATHSKPEYGQVDEVPQGAHSEAGAGLEACSAETEVKLKTAQHLLGELKALIEGQGSVAERLLCDLEQTVSSPPLNVCSSNVQTGTERVLSSLLSQNTQLCRRVRILNQQLKERERQQSVETHCSSEVLILQAELTAAQTQLHELQDDIAELRKALQETKSQLRDAEAENTLIKTDLKVTRSRLLDSERENSELALLAQQRLEEIQRLNRILQCQNPSEAPTEVTSLVSEPPLTKQRFDQYQHEQDLSESSVDRIGHYLLSLGQLEPTECLRESVERSEPKENVCVAAERETTHDQKQIASVISSNLNVRAKPAVTSDTIFSQSIPCISSHLDQSQSLKSETACLPARQLDFSHSHCDEESVSCDWSIGSGSTFDTRDEVAFRDGLAALDASIESLQRTIKMDLGR